RSIADEAPSHGVIPKGVNRWQSMTQRKSDDRLAVKSGSARRHDQTTIWKARERGGSTRDLSEIASSDRNHFNAEPFGCGRNRSELPETCCCGRVPKYRRPRQGRSHLFEQLHPLRG